MPYCRIEYSGDASVKASLARSVSQCLSSTLGKPEAYVVVNIVHAPGLMFGGDDTSPAAMIQVQSIGGDFKKVIGPLTEAVSTAAGVDSSRIFCNFQSFEGKAWGQAGSTFG